MNHFQNSVFMIGRVNGSGAFTINPGNGAYYDNNWNGSDDSYILKTFTCNNNINPTSIQTDSNNICINSILLSSLSYIFPRRWLAKKFKYGIFKRS